MWNLGTNSAFVLRPRKTTENLDRVSWSQDLWGTLSDGSAVFSFAGHRQRSLSQIWVPRDSWAGDTLGYPVPGGNKYRNLALEVRGVSKIETCASRSSSSYIATNGQSASLSWCWTPLEQMTKFYISFSDNYVLSSSCRALSLTRGPICNLQCNHASSSYIATDGQSVSSPWCRAPWGGPWPDSNFLCLTNTFFLLHVGCPHPYPPWTEWSSPKSKRNF
jgi:hypothetical protein